MNPEFYLNQQKLLGSRRWYRRFWEFCGIYSVAIYFLPAVIFIIRPQGWKAVLLAGLAGLIARYIACELVVLFYKKPHPYQVLKFTPPWSRLFSFLDQRHDAFPSQHIAPASAISAVMFLFSPAWGFIGVLCALFLSAGRIVLGYHDIWDVLGGWVMGILCALAVVCFLAPLFLK